MHHPYTITLEDGKYTVINRGSQLEFLRDGQSYLANIPVNSSEVLAMAQRIAELETTIRDVVDGSLLHSGRRDALGSMGAVVRNFEVDNLHRVAEWETKLRNVLEQKA